MSPLDDQRWLLAMGTVSCLVHLGLFVAADGLINVLSSDRVERSSVRIALGSSGAAPGQIEQSPLTEARESTSEQPVEQPSEDAFTETPDVVEPPLEVESTSMPEAVPEPVEVLPEPEPEPSAVQDVTGNRGLAGEREPSEYVDTDGDTHQEGFAAQYDFDGAVLAHLSGFRRFPMTAKMRGEEGRVVVSFMIDPRGRVVLASVTEGSGSRVLDRAALDQIKRAEPFPAAPPEATWSERGYQTTIRFELR